MFADSHAACESLPADVRCMHQIRDPPDAMVATEIGAVSPRFCHGFFTKSNKKTSTKHQILTEIPKFPLDDFGFLALGRLANQVSPEKHVAAWQKGIPTWMMETYVDTSMYGIKKRIHLDSGHYKTATTPQLVTAWCLRRWLKFYRRCSTPPSLFDGGGRHQAMAAMVARKAEGYRRHGRNWQMDVALLFTDTAKKEQSAGDLTVHIVHIQ